MELKDIQAGFKGNLWKEEINVRDFIQNNYTPYDGDESFLVGSTEKTRKIWDKLTELFVVEREKGVVDAETRLPQSLETYGAGYIDKENEVIVGLQTDAPLKRGIFPKGGIRMVENALKAYGYQPVKAVIPVNGIREVDIYLDGRPGYLKTTIDRGSGVTAEDADRMLRYLEGQGITTFEYIDVRIDGRAFWR